MAQVALEERFAEAAAEKEVADKKQMEKEHYDAKVAAAAAITKLKKPLSKIRLRNSIRSS